MDRNLWNCFSMIQAEDNIPVVIPDPPEVRSESDLQRVLDSIFTVDEKSGLPRTDVQYYLSPNGNPEVREWLINNLMKPRADKLHENIEGVTDDMLIEFTRQADEDIDSYRKRIFNLGVEAREFAEAHKPKDPE